MIPDPGRVRSCSSYLVEDMASSPTGISSSVVGAAAVASLVDLALGPYSGEPIATGKLHELHRHVTAHRASVHHRRVASRYKSGASRFSGVGSRVGPSCSGRRQAGCGAGSG